MKEPFKKVIASLWVLLLAGVIIYTLWPYASAFFGAVILYVLFLPLYDFLRRRKLGRGLAASLIIILTLLMIIVPSIFVIKALVDQSSGFSGSWEGLKVAFEGLDTMFPGLDLQSIAQDSLAEAGSYVKSQLVSFLQGIGSAAIKILIMYFLLFYLFVSEKDLKKDARKYIPFDDENAGRFYDEFVNTTKATVLATGMIAAMQGTMLGIALASLGFGSPFLWGFIGMLLSFIPVLGTPIIWLPASVYLFMQGRYAAGIILLCVGVFIGTVDNFIRPYIQRKVGRIHPLTSVLGIFIGLPLFGLVGIVIGPLLLSYLLLTVDMFRREYL
jgi:predicted PurR-regulated permease PerM